MVTPLLKQTNVTLSPGLFVTATVTELPDVAAPAVVELRADRSIRPIVVAVPEVRRSAELEDAVWR